MRSQTRGLYEKFSSCFTQKAIMSSAKILFLFLSMIVIIIICNIGLHSGSSNKLLQSTHESNKNHTTEVAYLSHRKLLVHGSCSNRDISISQSESSSTGIPQYIVQIVNTCVSDNCALSNIHLHCGWFASARMVNPRTFKRLSFDDCLVNGGKPLKNNQIISFTYSNSFMYPLAFKSAMFCGAREKFKWD